MDLKDRMILRPGGRAKPTEAGGVASFLVSELDSVCILQAEEVRGERVL
jgi:hypothetical protein